MSTSPLRQAACKGVVFVGGMASENEFQGIPKNRTPPIDLIEAKQLELQQAPKITLRETNISPKKTTISVGNTSSNHPFSGASC